MLYLFIFQGILVVDIETTKVTPILCSKSSVLQFMNIPEIVTASDISCFHHVNTCYHVDVHVQSLRTHYYDTLGVDPRLFLRRMDYWVQISKSVHVCACKQRFKDILKVLLYPTGDFGLG